MEIGTEKTTDSTIKLKEHQIALFEKCKYQESDGGFSKNHTENCIVEELEGEAARDEIYKRELDFLKKTIEGQASQIIKLQMKLYELKNSSK